MQLAHQVRYLRDNAKLLIVSDVVKYGTSVKVSILLDTVIWTEKGLIGSMCIIKIILGNTCILSLNMLN